MENWGANGESLVAIYAVEDGNLNGMWRVSPNVQYSVGNMVFGFEYELTSVNYMDEYQPGVEITGSHDVNNHRLLLSVMYTF